MLLQLCARLVRLSCYLIVCPSIHLPIHRLTQLFRLLISLFISLVLLVSCFCWFLSSFLFFFLYFWLHLICLFICQLSIYLRCCPHFIQALCCCPFETEYVQVHVYAAVIQQEARVAWCFLLLSSSFTPFICHGLYLFVAVVLVVSCQLLLLHYFSNGIFIRFSQLAQCCSVPSQQHYIETRCSVYIYICMNVCVYYKNYQLLLKSTYLRGILVARW